MSLRVELRSVVLIVKAYSGTSSQLRALPHQIGMEKFSTLG